MPFFGVIESIMKIRSLLPSKQLNDHQNGQDNQKEDLKRQEVHQSNFDLLDVLVLCLFVHISLFVFRHLIETSHIVGGYSGKSSWIMPEAASKTPLSCASESRRRHRSIRQLPQPRLNAQSVQEKYGDKMRNSKRRKSLLSSLVMPLCVAEYVTTRRRKLRVVVNFHKSTVFVVKKAAKNRIFSSDCRDCVEDVRWSSNLAFRGMEMRCCW